MRVVDYYWDHPDLKPYERSFNRNEFLFHQGEEGDVMYIIQRGAVELVVERSGKVLGVAVEDAGKFIGEKAIVSDTSYRRVFGARAMTDLVCLMLRRVDVDDLGVKNPELAKDLLKHMFLLAADRLDGMNRLAEVLRSSRNVDRFVKLIVHFARHADAARATGDRALVRLDVERVRHYIDMGDHEIEECFKVLEKRKLLVAQGKGIFQLPDEKALLQAAPLLREALPMLTVI